MEEGREIWHGGGDNFTPIGATCCPWGGRKTSKWASD